MFAINDDDWQTLEALPISLEELVQIQFENGGNILNFAIDNERVAIVQHLAKMTEGRPDLKRELIEHRFRLDQFQAIHQAVSSGNKAIIDSLLEDFGAPLDSVTGRKVTVMHCAAQTYQGYLSILVLSREHNFSVNVRDNFMATPLHFAILNREFMNVQLLIQSGADINA